MSQQAVIAGVDSCVWVAGLINAHTDPGHPCARIIRQALAGAFQTAVPARVEGEVRRVLARLEAAFEGIVERLEPVLIPQVPDPVRGDLADARIGVDLRFSPYHVDLFVTENSSDWQRGDQIPAGAQRNRSDVR